MNSCANLDANRTVRVTYRTGASNRGCRHVEQREEVIPESVHFTPTEPRQLSSNQGIVLIQNRTPSRIANLDRVLGRSNDVEKEDCDDSSTRRSYRGFPPISWYTFSASFQRLYPGDYCCHVD